MSKIALEGSTVADSVIQSHIYYRVYEYVGSDNNGDPIFAYRYYYAPATVKGTTKSTVTNVKINGKSPIVQGDRTIENDTFNLPSNGEYVSGAHVNAQGTVTAGNSRNVYANGKLIAVGGNSSVQTHAGTNVAINGNLSTNVNIGQ